jgi:NAD(P)-dependent dehydrogenase (short-subunit alcohol dehydrogenase family)
MRVVVADVDEAGLAETVELVERAGAEALAVPTDVSEAAAVRHLADRTLDRFGAVHVVCNNAGVFASGTCWEAPLEDYAWLLDVNVWGVVHGIRTFVPLLLAQAEGGHVVNTASMAAVTSTPYAGVYTMTKHAVLALSESLYHELTFAGGRVGVSVLCPEAVATGIADAERNRPARRRPVDAARSPEAALTDQAIREAIAAGVDPALMAERVERAIREGRFYVLAEDDEWRRACDTRLEDIRLGRNPTFSVPGAARAEET